MLHQRDDNEVALFIVVKPGQNKEGFFTSGKGELGLKVRAQPKEGEANQRVVEYLSEIFALPKRHIRIWRGENARQKEIRIQTSSFHELQRKIDANLAR